MGARVDGRPAEVHPHRPGRRRQLDERARIRVVEPHRAYACRGCAAERLVARQRRAARPRAPARGRAPVSATPQRAQVAADRLQLADHALRLLDGRAPRAAARAARRTARACRGPRATARPSPAASSTASASARASTRSCAPRSSGAASAGTPTRAASSSSESPASTSTDSERMRSRSKLHVVPRQAELLEVGAHRLGRIAGIAQRRDGRALGPLRQLLAVVSDDEAVVDDVRRLRAERAVQIGVQLLVRPVIGAANHVRDPEVDVVDDAREMKGRRAVARARAARPGRPARRPAACAASRWRSARSLCRTGPSSQATPSQREIGDDRLLAARNVPRRVGVVDPQQQVVAEAAVGDGAQRVADVERSGRAGREPDASHGPSLPGRRGHVSAGCRCDRASSGPAPATPRARAGPGRRGSSRAACRSSC